MYRSKLFRITIGLGFSLIMLGQTIPAFAAEPPPPPPNDTFLVPPEIQTLQAAPALGPGSTDAPGYYDTSVYAIGTVAVGLILPESNGGLDLNTEDWSSQEIANVKSEVQEALAWWQSQAPAAANLTFVLDSDAPRIVPTSYEPINRAQFDEGKWIGETLGNIGYSSGSYFDRAYAYVNDLRSKYNTDWAFVIFVADSSNDPDGYFKDMYFAYSYLGGPFMVMTYDNDGWGIQNMGQVTSHEMGHIFLAGDTYSGSGCSTTQKYGYLAISHTWCMSGKASIMNGNYTLGQDDPARGQIGWRDTDQDGIPDPIDTAPTVTLPAHTPNPTTETVLTYSGTVETNPYPHGTCSSGFCWSKDVIITKVSSVQAQINNGGWQAIPAEDGTYDEEIEQFTFTTGELPNGKHTIQVQGMTALKHNTTERASASTPATDSVIVGKSLQPGIYDNKDTAWQYKGTWTSTSNANAYEGDFRYSTKISNQATILFEGSKFSFFYTTGSAFGKMDIFVDNEKISTINQYQTASKYQVKYNSPSLTYAMHTVRFVHQSGARVSIDAIQTYGPPDLDPPARITDLNASTGTQAGSVELTWSAPAENSSTQTGNASSYLVRYSLSPIDDSNWDMAMPVKSGIPAPGAPTSQQQMTINGLVPATTYYFAIRAQDGEPNIGPLSNTSMALPQTPEPMGVGKYNDTHTSWFYVGKWNKLSSSLAYNKTIKTSLKVGNRAVFVFTGTNFTLGYLTASTYGKMEVYIDGVLVGTIVQAGPSKAKTFTIPTPLSEGTHTVQLVHRSGSQVNVDFIQVHP